MQEKIRIALLKRHKMQEMHLNVILKCKNCTMSLTIKCKCDIIGLKEVI
jgi:hypothetical protein